MLRGKPFIDDPRSKLTTKRMADPDGWPIRLFVGQLGQQGQVVAQVFICTRTRGVRVSVADTSTLNDPAGVALPGQVGGKSDVAIRQPEPATGEHAWQQHNRRIHRGRCVHDMGDPTNAAIGCVLQPVLAVQAHACC
ncbi:MAG: hypothetical protein VX549_13415 [Pseudomonadota bacterium]|nr:hypothetical protein [Pseudomonadota bacterium]